jgi:hypothetical protein
MKKPLMGQVKLHPSLRLFEADWLAVRRAPFGSYCVTSVVPAGFSAYVRILHPARGMHGERLHWADVAAKTDGTMHRLVEFHAINRSRVAGLAAAATPPEPGNLPSDLLKVACAALAKHTSTPDHCWFCLWNGYGWLDETDTAVTLRVSKEAGPQSTLVAEDWPAAPRIHFPQRDYLLFEGPLEAANNLGWNMPGGGFVPQSPNLFWPEDRAWCVASEIDLFCTLVAGSNALAETLLEDPRLEVWRVFPNDPVTADSDKKNT